MRKMASSNDCGEGKHVPDPKPEPLDDYAGGPHDTTLLTRYHVHVAMKAAEGEVLIIVILY